MVTTDVITALSSIQLCQPSAQFNSLLLLLLLLLFSL
jgi:hypothetical protein